MNHIFPPQKHKRIDYLAGGVVEGFSAGRGRNFSSSIFVLGRSAGALSPYIILYNAFLLLSLLRYADNVSAVSSTFFPSI